MIFVLDLDGTIIDSTKRHWYLLRELLVKNNIQIPINIEKDYIEFKRQGNSTKDYLRKIGISTEIANLISKKWVENIENVEFTDMDVLYKDSVHFLEMLHSKYNKIYFLSNRKNKNVLLQTLNRFNISKFASNTVVTTPQSGHKEKTLFLKILKEQSNEDIVMIGDTEVDYNAACEVDSSYYLLNRGFRSKEFWNIKNVKSYDSLDSILEEIL